MLEAEQPDVLVIDMVEDGPCDVSEGALMPWLRQRRSRQAVFLLIRSSSILDLDLVRAGERIVYCPANHGVPFLASPYPKGHGFKAVSTCVASPAVWARTAGVDTIRSAVVEPA